MTHLIISLPDGPERTHTQRAQFYRKEATTSSAYLEARIETADEFRGAGIEDGRITEAIKHDAILDRLVHNAHRLALKGESMRKKQGFIDSS